jgi:ABC-type transport system involved in multi-copper enzyme maturation permease subunit
VKFLAMLRDSLREALDAKVIYATLGLSILLIAVSATATFNPKEGGKNLMEFAALPLNVDLKEFDPMQFQRDGKGGGGMDPSRIAKMVRGSYKVASVTPVNEPEGPDATFEVTLVVGGGGLPGLDLFVGRPKPEKVLAEIRERFGQLDDVKLAEIKDVQPGSKPDSYVVQAVLTPQGKKLWPHDFSLFFGALPIFREGVPLGVQLYLIQTILLNQVGAWVILLISVILTAFFIPNMIRKGTVDLLIVKPVPRFVLLIYKYVGGLLFILINTTVAVGGVWLAFALRSGIWAPGVLISIPAITFFFAILYAVSTLTGVLTRSAIVAILVTCATWFFLFLVGLTNTITDVVTKELRTSSERAAVWTASNTVALSSNPLTAITAGATAGYDSRLRVRRDLDFNPGWFPPLVKSLHFFLPRTGDLTTLVDDYLQRDLMALPRAMRSAAVKTDPVSWKESLTVSGVFIALLLSISCWWFATKDY